VIKREMPTENRVRTSSMAQKIHFEADSIRDVRYGSGVKELASLKDKANQEQEIIRRKELMEMSAIGSVTGLDQQDIQDATKNDQTLKNQTLIIDTLKAPLKGSKLST
jgi:hypothetical protein